MTEVDWGSEGKEAPKKKKRIPGWLWFCGGGCALAVLVAIVAVIVVAKMGSDMMNQEKQKAELAKELPYDELPADWKIVGVGVFAKFAPGVEDAWQIQPQGGHRMPTWQAQFLAFEPGQKDTKRQIETGDLKEGSFGPIGMFESEHGTLDVQGRSLHWVRFQTFKKEAATDPAKEKEEPKEDHEPSIGEAIAIATKQRILMIDLTPEGRPGTLVLQYTNLGPGERVKDEDVLDFLSHFHVGPNH